jgi:putative aminopeptidase FrvX
MPIPPLLDELLRAHGASGHEDAVQAIVRRETAVIGAEVEKDVLGPTVATLKGSGGRLIALFAHADQVGHSAGEVAQLSDIDATSRLIEAYVRSLTAETSFLR